jgi:phosphatidylethanolamine/phosphatidyl-N-methylethanolamine N-methyltransferase
VGRNDFEPAVGAEENTLSFRDYVQFIAAFAAKPSTVGAIVPSSEGLCRRMVEWIDWSSVKTVVECGPGTGVFTAYVLSCTVPGTRFFAVEINPKFVDVLRKRFPDLCVYHEDVVNIRHLCTRAGVGEVEAIISSLPWASLSDEVQTSYLDAMCTVLGPGGRLATFAYVPGLLMPAAKRFRHKLYQRFSEVRISKTTWLNLPPAFVYQCRR